MGESITGVLLLLLAEVFDIGISFPQHYMAFVFQVVKVIGFCLSFIETGIQIVYQLLKGAAGLPEKLDGFLVVIPAMALCDAVGQGD